MSAPEPGLFSPLDSLRQLVAQAEDSLATGDVEDEVKSLQTLIFLADRELDSLAVRLRRAGWTWADIGQLFGFSRQNAQQRFGAL